MATFTQMKDEMKTCPYNPLHRVSARRFQQHIVKCSKNPSNPVLMDCPFNALHKIAAKELQQHILLCKDSRQVIREFEESQQRTASTSRPVLISRTEDPVSTEDWDDEGVNSKKKGYVIPGLVAEETTEGDDKKPFSIKSNIQIQCLKPAERKKYYKELVEHTRLSQTAEQSQTGRPQQTSGRSPQTNGFEVKAEPEGTGTSNVRKPHTMPFKPRVMAGIGRGSTPPVNRSTANRPIGITRTVINDMHQKPSTSSVKRERSDDEEGNGPKRFSPDLN